ncbi:MAG: site-2 protease family protein [Bacteriovoracaceae bacterium]|nr:site-2 protease family protein [Bacteriovoracaceae bacterium]
MENFILRLSIQVPGFLFAIIIHEAAHAYIANKHGDSTAKDSGRLSLNPFVHLDLLGTVIFPGIMLMMGWQAFGWAKPVPINPRNFKNHKKAIFWVSFAGPLSNMLMALLSAFLLAFVVAYIPSDFYLFTPFHYMLRQSVYINIILAVFNLIPFPPLDGSKMVATFLSYDALVKYEALTRYSFIFFILLMYTGVLKYVLGPALILGETFIVLFYQMLA